ncbi:MAG: penicillin-binding protein, partial [Cellulomonadaceae bacterium]|nr:penicillin-binding protein [Cellulomonadaceae bacterium]
MGHSQVRRSSTSTHGRAPERSDGTAPRRPRVGAALLAVALAASLASCTPSTPDPDAAAAALAQALTDRDLDGVPLSGATPAEATAALLAATQGLGEAAPTVTVAAVGEPTTEDDGARSASVELAFSWDLGAAAPWTYATTAHLDLVDGDWVTQWTTFLLAPDLRETETLSTARISAERGDVLGGQGSVVLVEERPVAHLGLDKTKVAAADVDASARQIATVLGVDPEGFAASAAAAGEKAFVEALVVRSETPGVDLVAFEALPGALSVAGTLPLAPTRQFARALLGTAGPATAEIIEESGGAVVAGEVAGLSGLQRTYDEQLRGKPGITVVATASDNGQQRNLFTVEPTAGEPLVTTLLPELQDAAELVLSDVVPASALVALRASTGEVLAAASGPGSDGYSTATLGTFPPGSTFKVVSTLALLRTGMTPESTVQCPTSIDVQGRDFGNVPGYPAAHNGTITLRTAVAQSCNTAFIGSAGLVDGAALVDAAASLGLGLDTDLGFAASLGEVPADSTGTDHAASMIGQGRVLASPLAMATVAASVARGAAVTPWLVGSTAPEAGPALSESEAAALRDVMRAVVTQGGGSALADLPGEPVLAKTGTAQYESDGQTRQHAWMIAV